MFFRLLMESFRRQRRRKTLAGLAILLGTAAVTAMLALALTVGDRIHQELAVYGANIVVYPKAEQLEVKVGGVDVKPASGGVYLKESDLEKLRGIFWANNITGVSPEFTINRNFTNLATDGSTAKSGLVLVTGAWFSHSFGSLTTGIDKLHPSWKLTGRWPSPCVSKETCTAIEMVVTSGLAHNLHFRIGDQIDNSFFSLDRSWPIRIVGTVETDSEADMRAFVALSDAQGILYTGRSNEIPDPITRVEISARTKPEDAFARKDPETLSPQQREIWYCRPYANSIAFQIREAIPGAQAEQVRRVEQSEGTVLKRISGLMWLVSAAALLAAGFAVSAAMATAILERQGEIGLMRSLGAGKGAIAMLFYAETAILAVIAGVLGYLLGSGLAAWLGARIFAGDGAAHVAVFNPVLLPIVVVLALVVAAAGSTPSIRSALKMDPAAILRADV